MTKHLLVDVTGHGYGHFAQTAHVLNALNEVSPNITITLRTALPNELVKSLLNNPVEHIQRSNDFGMYMTSALDVDKPQSAKAYQALHQHWDVEVVSEAELLQALAPDLVVSNVSYLTLAAAKTIDLPSIAFCSLNWAEIYRGYFHHRPEAHAIYQQMLTAYNSALVFFQPEPSMYMPGLDNLHTVGALAMIGTNQRAKLIEQQKLGADCRFVLVSLGGVATKIPVEQWPQFPDIVWVITWQQDVSRPDIVAHTQFDISFTDLIASCDAIITKPGYGTVVEAVCNQIPILYVARQDWPEEPYLIEWLAQWGRSQQITYQQLQSGGFYEELHGLFDNRLALGKLPSGNKEIAGKIANLLFSS